MFRCSKTSRISITLVSACPQKCPEQKPWWKCWVFNHSHLQRGIMNCETLHLLWVYHCQLLQKGHHAVKVCSTKGTSFFSPADNWIWRFMCNEMLIPELLQWCDGYKVWMVGAGWTAGCGEMPVIFGDLKGFFFRQLRWEGVRNHRIHPEITAEGLEEIGRLWFFPRRPHMTTTFLCPYLWFLCGPLKNLTPNRDLVGSFNHLFLHFILNLEKSSSFILDPRNLQRQWRASAWLKRLHSWPRWGDSPVGPWVAKADCKPPTKNIWIQVGKVWCFIMLHSQWVYVRNCTTTGPKSTSPCLFFQTTIPSNERLSFPARGHRIGQATTHA